VDWKRATDTELTHTVNVAYVTVSCSAVQSTHGRLIDWTYDVRVAYAALVLRQLRELLPSSPLSVHLGDTFAVMTTAGRNG